jgi:hypothetical protein
MLERSVMLQHRVSEEVGAAGKIEYETRAWTVKTDQCGT